MSTTTTTTKFRHSDGTAETIQATHPDTAPELHLEMAPASHLATVQELHQVTLGAIAQNHKALES